MLPRYPGVHIVFYTLRVQRIIKLTDRISTNTKRKQIQLLEILEQDVFVVILIAEY